MGMGGNGGKAWTVWEGMLDSLTITVIYIYPLSVIHNLLLEIGDGYELGVTMDRLFYDYLHSCLFIYCCYATYSSI